MTTGRGQDHEIDDSALETTARFTRRRLLLAGAGIGVGLSASALLAACGGDDDDDDDVDATPVATATTATDATEPTATSTGATEPVATTAAAAATTEPIASPTSGGTGSAGGWTFTDTRGVTITRDSMPTRVVAEVTSAATLWDMGIRPVGIYGQSRDVDGNASIQAGSMDLDAVTSLGEEWGVLDVEGLIGLQPDLIIDQDWGDGVLSGLTEEALGLIPPSIPTLCIGVSEGTLLDVIERYEAVAEALGADLNTPALVAARETFDTAVADLQAVLEARPDLTVMFASALTEGLYVAHPDAAADLRYYQQLGMDIVRHPVPEDFWELLSWEQVNRYPFDIIFLDARAGYERPEAFADIATWEQQPAVVADQVGPWYFDVQYTRTAQAAIINAMTERIDASDDVD